MKHVKKITILIFFIIGNVLLAQQNQIKKIQLKWIKSADFQVSENYKVKTILVENNFLDENLNPVYAQIWEVPNGVELQNYTIKNVVFEPVTNPEQSIVNIEKIASKIEINFNITNENQNAKAILELTPLIKEDNIIKKVVSFELNYETSLLQKKLTKSSSVKNSVLANGNWYRFLIDTTGVFKLDKSFLQSLGMDVKGINPKNIQIYGNGGGMLPFKNSDFRYDGLQQNAIFVSGEADNSFDNDDYILFYGKGPNTWFNRNNTLAGLEHQFNIFSDDATYFITIGTSEGLRVAPKAPIETATNLQITNFDDFTFFEKDEVNLFAVGQQWFGDNFSIENKHTYSIPFNNIDASENVIVRVRGVAESSVASQMEVKAGNQNLFNVNFSASSGLTHASANRGSGTIQLTGNSVPIEITYNNNGNPSANSYLDYIEVLGKKKLIANGKQFSFRNFDVIKTVGTFEYVIENASNVDQVWDVTNPLNPLIIVNQVSTS